MCFPRTGSASADPQLYKGIRIPRVFEGIRARDSSIEETSKLGLESSPEQEFSKMLVLAMFLEPFRRTSLERMVSAFALSRGRDVGGQEQLQESPWLAKLDVLCSGFSEKKDEGSHGNPEKLSYLLAVFACPLH